MKTSAILCTALVAAMGFSSLASAQGFPQERRDDRQERRDDVRGRVGDRQDVRDDRRERREDFADRRDGRGDQHDGRGDQHDGRGGNHDGRGDNHDQRGDYRDGRHWTPNNYGYNRGYSPGYYANTVPRFYRGGYLPYTYRQPTYYVNWRSYNSLYAPPYGYQWVQVGNELLLISLATGLIATAVAM